MTSPSATGRTRNRLPEQAWSQMWDSPVASYYLLIGAVTLLTALGLTMVLSSSVVTQIAAGYSAYREFIDQAQFVLMGVPILLVASRVPVSWYRRAAPLVFLLALSVQALVMIPGLAVSRGGNTGWVDLGPVQFQPSEVLKLGLALWLGVVLGRKQRRIREWKHALVPALPGALIAIGLVLAGRDLGTALVFGLLTGGAFFIAGIDIKLLFFGSSIGIILVLLFLVRGNSNRTDRIFATYGGACDAQSTCYQSLHSKQGLATGGLTGVGLGAGREKWNYLPEAHNDFIYSVIGEELGLLGALLVLGLFVVLGIAMNRIIRRHQDPFVKITTAAIAVWIVGQALVNIGVVIGLLPVVGVPLPLVSAGGSALVMTMAALGVVISFARNEPGAPEALAARAKVVRRSLAVMARPRTR